MNQKNSVNIANSLLKKKDELEKRLERIGANLRRTLDADSKEQARELADKDVVDALGNEARSELAAVNAALERLSRGSFGSCSNCGDAIGAERLAARPYADECYACASSRDDQNIGSQARA